MTSSSEDLTFGLSNNIRYWQIEDAFRVKKEVFLKFYPFQKHAKTLACLRMRYHEMYYKGELPEMTEEEANRLALCVCLQGISDLYYEGKAIDKEETSELPQENIPLAYIGIALEMPPSLPCRDWLTLMEQADRGCTELLNRDCASFMTFRKGRKFDPFQDDFQINLFLVFFKGSPCPILHERLTSLLKDMKGKFDKLSVEGWYEHSHYVSTYLLAWLGLTLSMEPFSSIQKDKVKTFEDLGMFLYTPGGNMDHAMLFWNFWVEYKKKKAQFRNIKEIHAGRVRSLMALSYMYTTCNFPLYFKEMEDTEDEKIREQEKGKIEDLKNQLDKAKLKKYRKQQAEERSITEMFGGLTVDEGTTPIINKKNKRALVNGAA